MVAVWPFLLASPSAAAVESIVFADVAQPAASHPELAQPGVLRRRFVRVDAPNLWRTLEDATSAKRSVVFVPFDGVEVTLWPNHFGPGASAPSMGPSISASGEYRDKRGTAGWFSFSGTSSDQQRVDIVSGMVSTGAAQYRLLWLTGSTYAVLELDVNRPVLDEEGSAPPVDPPSTSSPDGRAEEVSPPKKPNGSPWLSALAAGLLFSVAAAAASSALRTRP